RQLPGLSPALAYLKADQPAVGVGVLLVIPELRDPVVQEGRADVEYIDCIELQQGVLQEARAKGAQVIAQLCIEGRVGPDVAMRVAAEILVVILKIDTDRGCPAPLLP